MKLMGKGHFFFLKISPWHFCLRGTQEYRGKSKREGPEGQDQGCTRAQGRRGGLRCTQVGGPEGDLGWGCVPSKAGCEP